ncbi:hypothetical protein BN4901_3864 [Citrobacter europaeus]|uniref:Uncharacterized protein n=1 Tax=Citrobacter europaeus TaxID=1914243 RepID=A0ABY0JTD9_9ENTR|nr:hypothetical protein BN4901_3864 [Citrobacter europaeus]
MTRQDLRLPGSIDPGHTKPGNTHHRGALFAPFLCFMPEST